MNQPKSDQNQIGASPAFVHDLPIAYIKAFEMDGTPGYAVHAVDGEMIGWCEDRAVAFAAAAQNELLAFSVH